MIKLVCYGVRETEVKYFEEIKDKVEFKKWYFGHYHKNDDTTFDKFACLYEKIIEIK